MPKQKALPISEQIKPALKKAFPSVTFVVDWDEEVISHRIAICCGTMASWIVLPKRERLKHRTIGSLMDYLSPKVKKVIDQLAASETNEASGLMTIPGVNAGKRLRPPAGG